MSPAAAAGCWVCMLFAEERKYATNIIIIINFHAVLSDTVVCPVQFCCRGNYSALRATLSCSPEISFKITQSLTTGMWLQLSLSVSV